MIPKCWFTDWLLVSGELVRDAEILIPESLMRPRKLYYKRLQLRFGCTARFGKLCHEHIEHLEVKELGL